MYGISLHWKMKCCLSCWTSMVPLFVPRFRPWRVSLQHSSADFPAAWDEIHPIFFMPRPKNMWPIPPLFFFNLIIWGKFYLWHLMGTFFCSTRLLLNQIQHQRYPTSIFPVSLLISANCWFHRKTLKMLVCQCQLGGVGLGKSDQTLFLGLSSRSKQPTHPNLTSLPNLNIIQFNRFQICSVICEVKYIHGA